MSKITKNEFVTLVYSFDNWKKSRKISTLSQKTPFNNSIAEELEEFLVKGIQANNMHEKIDALCDIAVFTFTAFDFKDEDYDLMTSGDHFSNYHELYNYFESIKVEGDVPKKEDALNFISILFNTIHSYGYNPYRCMLEAYNEISSRTQCADQLEEWKAIDELIKNTDSEFEKEKLESFYGKWKKSKDEKEIAKWYKANFEICKNEFK